MIRATYELEPDGSAAALAVAATVGVPDGPAFVRGQVVEEGGGRAVIDVPDEAFGGSLPALLSALVGGEAGEDRSLTRCRLVGLDLTAGFLPGPSFPAPAGVGVGAIVKPSLGLGPAAVAEIAGAAAAGGAVLVKDDEKLGDPPWCRLEERVTAVAAAVGRSVVYCANVTGPVESLVERAGRAVALGATGVMVNAFVMGLDAVRALRDAALGVPVFAHRVGSGPLARNERFGVAPAVLAGLTRLAGADYVIVGSFGGTLFETDEQVRASLDALRRPLDGGAAPVAVIGGGIGPDNARAQVEAAGGGGLLVLVGSAAYRHPGGLEAGVRATCEAVA
ncbi:MAG: RuBisCO large subunit C-terminal-like domain-containing protein [Acidimicrobiales bacterium]